MDQLICFRHPYYNPQKKPDLNCSSCCKIFVAQIKKENSSSQMILTSEKKELECMPQLKASGFCPISI